MLVESVPASSVQEMQQRRRSSPGLTERDVRILESNIDSMELLSPRRTLHPARVLPKPSQSMPNVYGVRDIIWRHPWHCACRRADFLSARDNLDSAAVCVLGDRAKVSLLGYGPGATGKFIKVNDTWFEVIGVVAPQVASDRKGRAGARIATT